MEESPDDAFLQLYRIALGRDGVSGPVSPFADLSREYDRSLATIDHIACHPDTGQVLVTVGNRHRMDDDDSWWTELWLFDRDGRPVEDHALARSIGPDNVAWSPDGRSLLLEASPMHEAGVVYLFDLETESAQKLEDVGLAIPAGAGGGSLAWGGDGRFAVASSWLIGNSGCCDQSFQVVEVTDPVPERVADRLLTDTLGSAWEANGTLVYLVPAAGPDEDLPATADALRWDPATAAVDPIPIGRLRLPGIDLERIFEIASLPPSRSRPTTERLLLVGQVRRGMPSALLLADVTPTGGEGIWRLSPADVSSVGQLSVTDGYLAYRAAVPNTQDWYDLPLDVATQLRIIPLDALEPERLGASSDFEWIPAP